MSNENAYVKPVLVAVVEPRHGIWWHLARIVGGIAGAFLLALIAWWLGPFIFGDWYALGYWQTFALVFFLRALVPRARSFQYQSNVRAEVPWL